MKNKRFIFFFLLLFFFFSAFASAADIVDKAGILSEDEKKSLFTLLDSVASSYKFDLVIVIEKDIEGKSTMAYADDYFDNNGYGYGEDRDGCLLLQVTESRDYWFSTSGRGIDLLDGNDYAFDKLEADVIKFLSTGNNYEAYRSFILNMEKFLSLEARGRSYNFLYRRHLVLTGIAWIVAFLIGSIILIIWKKGMNTAAVQTQAAVYVIPGSFNFREKKDRFLYSTVTKTIKQSSSSSGGSRSHTSSSGRSHGGRGGRY
jgi:uncharacterized protein